MLTKKQIMKILYKKYGTTNYVPRGGNGSLQICQICDDSNDINFIFCNKCSYNGSSTNCYNTMYNDYISYTKLIAWNNLTC